MAGADKFRFDPLPDDMPKKDRERALAAAREIDVSQLTDEQRRQHERFVLLEAWRLRAEAETTTKFVAAERKRTTPLPGWFTETESAK